MVQFFATGKISHACQNVRIASDIASHIYNKCILTVKVTNNYDFYQLYLHLIGNLLSFSDLPVVELCDCSLLCYKKYNSNKSKCTNCHDISDHLLVKVYSYPFFGEWLFLLVLN